MVWYHKIEQILKDNKMPIFWDKLIGIHYSALLLQSINKHVNKQESDFFENTLTWKKLCVWQSWMKCLSERLDMCNVSKANFSNEYKAELTTGNDFSVPLGGESWKPITIYGHSISKLNLWAFQTTTVKAIHKS